MSGHTIMEVRRRYYSAQASVVGHVWLEPGIDQSATPPPTVTVLVAGDPDVGDYAAYTGHGEPPWVRDHGDKISFAEAKALFSWIEEDRYRE